MGLVLKKGTDYLFDYVAYPAALLWLGYVAGGAAMAAASVLVNIAVLRVYDWSRRDFLLLESIKDLRQLEGTAPWRRAVSGVIRSGDIPAFFILSCLEDPVVATLYLRRGSHLYNGFALRDWTIFLASTLLSNLVWTLHLSAWIALARAGLAGLI
ncbi:hypothetical protein [Rubellimicrobium arenae]|uniref:hypothetical protein n=1 Tax=Rubellimicrobium arenae TaxID=2817372 RepID=UPI001B30122F|nr:hypothetical protein [Rubellimicrobium arenae]